MAELEQIVWGHDAKIQMLEKRAVEDRAAAESRFVQMSHQFETKFAQIESAVQGATAKLDTLLTTQTVAVALREEQNKRAGAVNLQIRIWLAVITALIPLVGLGIDFARRGWF